MEPRFAPMVSIISVFLSPFESVSLKRSIVNGTRVTSVTSFVRNMDIKVEMSTIRIEIRRRLWMCDRRAFTSLSNTPIDFIPAVTAIREKRSERVFQFI